jgi:hypothetical protein
VIVQPQVSAMAFEVRFAQIRVHKRVVLELGVLNLVRGEIEQPLEYTEGFSLAEDFNGQEIGNLENEAASFRKQDSDQPFDFIVDYLQPLVGRKSTLEFA